jgi:hypothetical protein
LLTPPLTWDRTTNIYLSGNDMPSTKAPSADLRLNRINGPSLAIVVVICLIREPLPRTTTIPNREGKSVDSAAATLSAETGSLTSQRSGWRWTSVMEDIRVALEGGDGGLDRHAEPDVEARNGDAAGEDFADAFCGAEGAHAYGFVDDDAEVDVEIEFGASDDFGGGIGSCYDEALNYKNDE